MGVCKRNSMKKTTKARIWFGIVAVVLVAGIAASVITVVSKAESMPLPTLSMDPSEVMPAELTPRKAQYDKRINPEPLTAAPIAGERIIKRSGYTCSYNNEKRQANYVAWSLTKARTYGEGKREPQFYEDPTIEKENRALLSDYYNSGMSRGHMCPAADNKWNAQAMAESFMLTNICPQTYTLNGEDWEHLESFCRRYVRKNHTVLHIICGPIYTSDPARRRRRRLYVPDKFFKTIVCLDKGDERGIGFIYDNNDETHPMSYYVQSIDQVEKLTGLDLYNKLDKKLQQRIEAQANFKDWE